MKKNIFRLSIVALFINLSLLGCKPEIDEPSYSRADLDFTHYVAFGNSLTAGYADGGLYREGQLNSYPNILAQQLKAVGGGEFEQPLFTEEQQNGSGYLRLKSLEGGRPQFAPVITNLAYTDANRNRLSRYKAEGYQDVQNLGVPGIRVADISSNQYALANMFFERLLPANGNPVSYITMAAQSKPSFFSVWLGNNDVLGYAMTGGAFGTTGQAGIYLNGITPESVFRNNLTALVDTLSKHGAEGIIANIPDVTAAPYFTAIPYNVLPLTAQQAQQAQAAYSQQYNPGIRAYNAAAGTSYDTVSFREGQNAPIIEDQTMPNPLPKFRQLKQGELILLSLPVDSLAAGWGTSTPIPNRYILTSPELTNIVNATNTYNQIIKQIADNKQLALFDAKAYLARLKTTGINVDNVSLTNAAYITGNAFSLDGIHLTPRGYALTANEMIRTINLRYGTTIPLADEINFRGVIFPK